MMLLRTASQTTEKHSNVTPERRRMAEQRDMDKFLDNWGFGPAMQRDILSQSNPADHILQFYSGFLPPARAVLVRHRNIHWTNEMVAQAIVDAMTIRVVVAQQQQQPPPPGPAIAAAAAAAVPDPQIPGPADAAGDNVSSWSSFSAVGSSCDNTVALANNWTGTSVLRPTWCSSRGGTAPPVIPTLCRVRLSPPPPPATTTNVQRATQKEEEEATTGFRGKRRPGREQGGGRQRRRRGATGD
jgi:hypothetical protein